MGIVLYIVATILFLPLSLFNLVAVIVKYYKEGVLKTVNSYFYQSALDIDRFANRNYRTLWNGTLITKGGIKFGNELETISSVLGKNERKGTLTNMGSCLVNLLNLFEKDHCLLAINDNVINEIK